jgi:hypothetical protein
MHVLILISTKNIPLKQKVASEGLILLQKSCLVLECQTLIGNVIEKVKITQ